MEQLKRTFSKADWVIEEVKTMYQGFFKIESYLLKHKLFNGGWSRPIRRELFVRGSAVAVLLYDPQRDQVALLEQFRIGALNEEEGPWLYEIVAGMIDGDDTQQDTAIRECIEETGVTPKKLIPICEYLAGPGGSSEKLAIYCGISDLDGVAGNYGETAEDEDIRVQIVSTDIAFNAVVSGKLNNAASIIALQWLQLNMSQFENLTKE